MQKAFTAAVAAALVSVGIVLASLPASAAPSSDGAPTVTVVASGLNSPKQLTLGPGGVYVAESGTGGSTCVTADGISECEGETGTVALVTPFGTRNVLAGLPSVLEGGQGAGGPVAIAFNRGKAAVLFQDTAVNPDGTTAVQGPGSDDFGKLLLARPFSRSLGLSVRADLAAFAAVNPQDPATLGGSPGGETTYDSDPYDIVRYRDGFAIADAGANDVLWLSRRGQLSILDRLPTIPTVFDGITINAQPVPTSLAVGPDGALYVGELVGFPGQPGTSSIYRIVPGQVPNVVASGLTAVTAIAFDREGRLLAAEYSTGGLLAPPTVPGALVRVDISTGTVTTLPVSGLSQPTGLAVDWRGDVFVSNNGNSAGTGEVLRINGLD
jgi:hypothetical protein